MDDSNIHYWAVGTVFKFTDLMAGPFNVTFTEGPEYFIPVFRSYEAAQAFKDTRSNGDELDIFAVGGEWTLE